MIVSLMKKNTIYKLELPKQVAGSYWITEKIGNKERKLVNIQEYQGKWQILNNINIDVMNMKYIDVNVAKFGIVNNGKKTFNNNIVLEENEMYYVYLRRTNELFVMYCEPSFDNGFVRLDILNNEEILIGRGIGNPITYNNKMVENEHARFIWSNGRMMIENLDNCIGTFVNNEPVGNEGKILENGDVIFIMGLKIIKMGRSIFINDPNGLVGYKYDGFKVNNEVPRIMRENGNEVVQQEELYEDSEYFSRAPRIKNIIETEKVKIDAPPHIQDKEEMPIILAIGSSLSMGIIMISYMFNAIDGRNNGTTSDKQMIVSLITAMAMLVSMILFPVLTIKYNRKRKEKYEEKRQKKYKEYLENKNNQINDIMVKQRKILFDNYPSTEECTNIILHKGARLWERKIDDYDFLTIRLGIGDVPLKLDIQYPEEQFSMDDDNLIEILDNMVENSKVLKSAPITLSLVQKNVSALIIEKNNKLDRILQSIILQLVAFHSYEDLKLVFLLKKDEYENLEYAKMLPHVWDNDKQIRFFSYDYDEMNEISKYLEDELQERLEYDRKDYTSFSPYYLIITNDYKKIENLKIITEILKTKENVGFSILCITTDMMQLPNECKTFVSIDKDDKVGILFDNEISKNSQKHIALDSSTSISFERICQKLSNIPIRYTQTGTTALPTNYTFLEMYDVGRIEQLNIWERWTKHDSTLSLRAPVGIDSSQMPIVLDIHEKFHGPHGIIAGSTGSGKSEFIITYILSLAINYHPDDVSFILIDYKGGGLAGAFDNAKVKLPHLVGTITNIDTIELQRSLTSIQSELRRRQIAFNKARNLTDEGTIDIYKYQKMYHEGLVKEPIPHLLIICDEFAELKQQQQEFMDELVSVSRIGRSLGVHLILATQKPAGIVNEQIRSNSKFAICLKVQEREDSIDVIKRPDAANLKKVGQFYMQVGNDEYFVLGQSAYSGAKYIPTDITEKKIDNSVQFISDIGTVIKQVDDNVQQRLNTRGEQLTSVLHYISNLAKEKGIKEENLWLPSIPKDIYLKDLIKKYHVKVESKVVEPVIGEYDDPFNQRQDIYKLNLSYGGNVVIYGNAESGKENLLSTMIYDIISTHTSDEANIYILDFGTEALKIYRDAPQVGDVVFLSEKEKITRFFNMIQQIIRKRKNDLLEYNGDYKLFLETSGKSMPLITAVLNNYDSFSEMYQDNYEDILMQITREGTKCGITFVFTASLYNSLRYRLTQNFKQKIALQMNDESDYYSIFEKVKKKRPSHLFGRGLISPNGDVYEFQTAQICKPESYNDYVRNLIGKLEKQGMKEAKQVPTLPEKVKLSEMKKSLKGLSFVPIGITKKDLRVYGYNFQRELVNIVTSADMDATIQFAKNILDELELIEDIDLYVFDVGNSISSEGQNEQEKFFKMMSGLQHKNKKHTLMVIVGIEKFLEEISTLQLQFSKILAKMEESKNANVIIIESMNKLKNHEYDEWYKTYVSKDNGIWIGNGIDSQYLLTINSERKEMVSNCGNSFGYAIRQGIVYLIKLLEMKENGDNNEQGFD